METVISFSVVETTLTYIANTFKRLGPDCYKKVKYNARQSG